MSLEIEEGFKERRLGNGGSFGFSLKRTLVEYFHLEFDVE